jgi:MerR family transcriptional regulator, light-induced transcriptional regulator
MQDEAETEIQTFKIGAVARLTGVTSHTLRKWETRYQAVVPLRTEHGDRLYTRDDLEKLSLIKQLVDQGIPPSDVAGRSQEGLVRKLEDLSEVKRATDRDNEAAVRIIAVGHTILGLLEFADLAAKPRIEVVASAKDISGISIPVGDVAVDVVILECPIVHHDTHASVEKLRIRLNATYAVVAYGFGTRNDLLSLQSHPFRAIRSPVDLPSLKSLLAELIHHDQPVQRTSIAARRENTEMSRRHYAAPQPRLSLDVVSRFARTTPQVACECPKHLADILFSLRAFEEYAQSCETLNPEDAALHQYLFDRTGHARALFEQAIEKVAEAEGFDLQSLS